MSLVQITPPIRKPSSTAPAVGAYIGSITNILSPETSSTEPTNYSGSITNVYTAAGPSSTYPINYATAVTNVVTASTNRSTHRVTYTTNYDYSTISYEYAQVTSYSYAALVANAITNSILMTNWTITFQPGIVLSNGAILPAQGLSIATPDPAYIIGNWNVKTNFAGTNSDAGLADTTYAHPSAIFADAITVLSQNWSPANSALSLVDRTATNDTVNAAFYTGNVPSDGTNYSGGLENLPRWLEELVGRDVYFQRFLVLHV